MRIVHSSDWHIGRMLYEYSLIEDQKYFSENFEDFLAEENADVLIIAGDVYDKSVPSAEAVKLLDDIFYNITAKLGIKVIAISGNHDSSERLSYCSRLYKEKGLHIAGEYCGEIEKITIPDSYGNVNFYLLPYIQPAEVRRFFTDEKIKTFDDAYRLILQKNKSKLNMNERNVIISHGFFSAIGSSEEKNIITSDSEISVGGTDIADAGYFIDYDYTALGHLHSPQKILYDRIRYAGSPLKYSLSEAKGDKSVVVIDMLEKGNVDIKLKSIKPLHDVSVIRDSFDNLINPIKYKHLQSNYIFAEITDDKPILYAMEKLKCVYYNMLGLKYCGSADVNDINFTAVNDVKKVSPDILFSQFYSSIKDAELSGEQAELINNILIELQREDVK